MSDGTVIDRFERERNYDFTVDLGGDTRSWFGAFDVLPYMTGGGHRYRPDSEPRGVERHIILKRAAKRKARKAAKHARRRNVK